MIIYEDFALRRHYYRIKAKANKNVLKGKIWVKFKVRKFLVRFRFEVKLKPGQKQLGRALLCPGLKYRVEL